MADDKRFSKGGNREQGIRPMIPPWSRPWRSIWLVVLCAVLPTIAFGIAVAAKVITDNRSHIEERYNQVARALISAVDTELMAQIRSAQGLAALDTGDLAEFTNQARRVVAARGDWHSAHVMGHGGKVLASTTGEVAAGDSATVAQPETIERVFQTGTPMIGTVATSGYRLNEPYIPVGVPIFHDGQVAAVLLVSVKPAAIRAIMREQGLGTEYLLTVFDADLVIASRSDNDTFVGHDAADSIRKHVASGEHGLFLNITLEGNRFIRLMERSQVTGWHVAVGMNETAFIEQLRATPLRLAAGAAAVVLIALVSTILAGRRFGARLVAEHQDIIAKLRVSEEQKSKALAEAQAASLAKSRFFAAASHDLRQPFQAMRLFFEVLQSSANDRHTPVVERLGHAMGAAEALLNELLDVARLESGTTEIKAEEVNLGQLLAELEAELLPVAIHKGLALKVWHPPTIVDTDHALLKRILFNITTNALRYTKHGGVLIGLRRRPGRVMVEVWDTGIGIAEDHVQRIFDDFYQVNNSARDRAQGTGLGLAIVKRLSDLLHYEVTVTSRLGHGTVFRVAIPVATRNPEETTNRPFGRRQKRPYP